MLYSGPLILAVHIKGNLLSDHRAIIRFVDDFNLGGIKKFYAISHPDTSVLRAWQGHERETIYLFVASGSFLINWIEHGNWENPGKELPGSFKIMSDKKSEILKIAPGHVNGLKALQADSTLIIFSDMYLHESKLDDFRFPCDYRQMQMV